MQAVREGWKGKGKVGIRVEGDRGEGPFDADFEDPISMTNVIGTGSLPKSAEPPSCE